MAVKLAASENIPVTPQAGTDCVLNVPYCSQRPFQHLCWAACCEMVLKYNNKNVPNLCNITSAVFKPEDCCSSPSSCDRTEWPDVAYGKLNFQCLEFDQPFDTDALSHEIRENGRPVQALLDYDGTAHVVVIAGLYADNDLLVLDPLRGSAKCSYESLLEAFGDGGQWERTYYNLIPN